MDFLKFTKRISITGIRLWFLILWPISLLSIITHGFPISKLMILSIFAFGILWSFTAFLKEEQKRKSKNRKPQHSLNKIESLIYSIQTNHDSSFPMLFFTISVVAFLSIFTKEADVGLIVPFVFAFIFLFILSFIVLGFSRKYFEKRQLKKGYKIPLYTLLSSVLIFIAILCFVLSILALWFWLIYFFKNHNNETISIFVGLAPIVLFGFIGLMDLFRNTNVLIGIVNKIRFMDKITYPIRKWILGNVKCPKCKRNLKKCNCSFSMASMMSFKVYCENCRKYYIIETGIIDRTLKFKV